MSFTLSSLQPTLNSLGIPHLSTHLPTVLKSFLFWLSLQFLSSRLSPRLFPRTYPALPRLTRISWDVHFVAFAHACLIVPLTINVWNEVRAQGERHPLGRERTYGYDFKAGQVYAVALGYFIWDSIVSILYDGPGFIAHGLVALTAFTLVYHPIFMYDGLGFLLWEISTPFLNVHWFLDKLGKTGSRAQLVNAVFLLGSYVGARLTFGTYNSYNWFMHLIAPTVPHSPAIPTHLLLFYGIGNVTLNFLNFFWFRAMVRAVRKRFVVQPQPGSGSQADADKADLKKIATGKQGIKVDVKGSGDEPFEKEARVGKHEKKDL